MRCVVLRGGDCREVRHVRRGGTVVRCVVLGGETVVRWSPQEPAQCPHNSPRVGRGPVPQMRAAPEVCDPEPLEPAVPADLGLLGSRPWSFVPWPELRQAPGCRGISGAHPMSRKTGPHRWPPRAMSAQTSVGWARCAASRVQGLGPGRRELYGPSAPRAARGLLPHGLCSGRGPRGRLGAWHLLLQGRILGKGGFLDLCEDPWSWRACTCSPLFLPAREFLDLRGQKQQSLLLTLLMDVLPILRQRLLKTKGHKSTRCSPAHHLVLGVAGGLSPAVARPRALSQNIGKDTESTGSSIQVVSNSRTVTAVTTQRGKVGKISCGRLWEHTRETGKERDRLEDVSTPPERHRSAPETEAPDPADVV